VPKKAPILHLDVHIGDGIVKDLFIYDLDSAAKDATEFWKMHGLPDYKINILTNVIKQELQWTLTRIDEEDEF